MNCIKDINWTKNIKVEKSLKELKIKGFNVIIYEVDMICLMNKKGIPAEIHRNGNIVYPIKRKEQSI